MIGALASVSDLPLMREDFEESMIQNMKPDKIELNLKAFDVGAAIVQ